MIHSKVMHRCWTVLLGGALASVGATGCDDGNQDPGGSSGGTSGSGGGGGTGGNTASGGLGGMASDHCAVDTTLSGCTGERVSIASLAPLDLYIMFDSSGSMANFVDEAETTTRFDEVYAAVMEFLADPDSAGAGAGLGYFGHEPYGDTSCVPAAFETPAVPIAPLPDNSSLLLESLSMMQPYGETPTPPAIEGACNYAQGHQMDHPERHVAILLVTDGEPKTNLTDGCDPTIEQAVAAAEACLQGTPSIATYVLGVGPLLESLNQIAVAGGTESAFLVDDGEKPILEALNQIRDAKASCQTTLPQEVEALDPLQLNLVSADAACSTKTIPYVSTADGCNATSGGWYLDDPGNPSAVSLCPASCVAAREPETELHFVEGCPPEEQ